MTPHLLKTKSEIEKFITALDEKPEHTISIHQLRNNLAQVMIIGEVDNFSGAVVQYHMLPEEPIAFGDSADAIWKILQKMQGWRVVEVAKDIAEKLDPMMQAGLERPIRHYDDVYYMLDTPLKDIPPHDESVTVRLLNENDIEMVQATPEDSRPMILDSISATLRDAVVAGAIVDGELVGFSEAREADKHVELGVLTHEKWRKKGIASSAAGLLIKHFQPKGYKIVWSTAEDNWASQRVAEKLGMREIFRRVYLIPEKDE